MKYFTPMRYIALQDFRGDARMDAADAVWEQASHDYNTYLERIMPTLPHGLRQFVDGCYLHDASVLSMGRQGNDFVMVLQEDAPPNGLLMIRFMLSGDPTIDREALPLPFRSPSPLWLHEEIEVVGEEAGRHFRLSILLDNGWEIMLPIRDVQIQELGALFPVPRNDVATFPAAGIQQTAHN